MSCDLCGGIDLRLVFSLGSSPPTCAMQKVGERRPELHYPLDLLECQDCTLVQLAECVPPEALFSPDFPYSSGNSRALHENFEDLAGGLEVGPDDLVVDIGANDGTLLSKFDCRTVGVEPTGQAEKIDGPVYREFFSEDVAERIRAEHGPARVVTACNVLAHVADLGGVMRGIVRLLADDGVLVAENHDLASVLAGQWDTIYHEHLRYFSPHSFERLLHEHHMRSTACVSIPTHGGSFRVTATKGKADPPSVSDEDFTELARDAESDRRTIRGLATRAWGIGATARATTIVNYCGLDVEDLECVCEVSGSDKIGRYIPGTRIPVVDEERLIREQPPRALLLSWHLADQIIPALREKGYRGEIFKALA